MFVLEAHPTDPHILLSAGIKKRNSFVYQFCSFLSDRVTITIIIIIVSDWKQRKNCKNHKAFLATMQKMTEVYITL